MRVFILGKPREVTHWTEDCVAGFEAAGHDTSLGVTRDPRLHPAIELALMSPWTGGILVNRLLRAIRDFRPDLILAVRALALPMPILEGVHGLIGRPPLIGWVGDGFTAGDRASADRFDILAYTDTAMLARHEQLRFRPAGVYLPHAANGRLRRGGEATAADRDPNLGLVFVANPTPRRHAIVSSITRPVALFGPGWAPSPGRAHRIDARRISVTELARLYAASAAVLNIHHEDNVANGLNQRHFDPALFGVPVLSDAQADLALCFEPGREVLVWRDTDELNALHERLLHEPDWARAIGDMARRRVMAEHLYSHRLETLCRLI